MGFFGPSEVERRLALCDAQLAEVERGRDSLARALIYRELMEDNPLLALTSAQLLYAGYTQEEVTKLLEETKREFNAKVP